MIVLIVNILLSFLLACLFNFTFFEKRRYLQLKKLNAELELLLKAFELEHKGIPIPDHIQRYIKERYDCSERYSGKGCT